MRQRRTGAFPPIRRSLLGVVLLCGALAVVSPVGVSRAVAAPAAWSVTASPSRGWLDNLSGVSCSSAGFCAAVGAFHGRHHSGTLIEMWDGRRWSLVRSPSPGQAPDRGTLLAVSCPSSAFCVAVGYFEGTNNDRPLIEIWDGRRWSASPSPHPGGYTHLLGVSCVSARACEAVGYRGHSCGPRASGTSVWTEGWDGREWSVDPAPDRPCRNESLNAVSCISASSCTAVGYYKHAATSSDWTLVDSWDGRRWSTVSSPNARPNNNNVLGGVSCSSARSCVAVGSYQRVFDGPGLTLAEMWNGTRWSTVASPSTGSPYPSDELTSVWCTSPTNCVAVGDRQTTPTNYSKTLIETWDGTAWRRTSSPNPRDSQRLLGVVCTVASTCEAVGSAGPLASSPDQTLVETGGRAGG